MLAVLLLLQLLLLLLLLLGSELCVLCDPLAGVEVKKVAEHLVLALRAGD
jgi:hypothetical protein